MRTFLSYPAIDDDRLAQLCAAAPQLRIVNAADADAARQEIAGASGFFGKITPELLERATRLEWIQSPTASLEHYLFPELVAHPCRLSNMRGIFSDVIADHVMGYVLCFARNLHTYIRRQPRGEWRPVGDDVHLDMSVGPGRVSGADRAHRHLADCTLGVVGVGGIGAEICRRAAAFGMRLTAVDPQIRAVPGVVAEVWPVSRLRELLEQSDFVVIAAPHTPETEKLIHYEQLCWMQRSAVLINVGRGIIVDLADLTRALEEGRIAGAALDVLESNRCRRTIPSGGALAYHYAARGGRIAANRRAALRVRWLNVRRSRAASPRRTSWTSDAGSDRPPARARTNVRSHGRHARGTRPRVKLFRSAKPQRARSVDVVDSHARGTDRPGAFFARW
jgi:phosphoglycerate dehydrogenase-like enzyme